MAIANENPVATAPGSDIRTPNSQLQLSPPPHIALLSKQSATVSFIIGVFTLRASGEVADFGSSFKKQFNRDRGDCHREK
jgi:hypothetical protein